MHPRARVTARWSMAVLAVLVAAACGDPPLGKGPRIGAGGDAGSAGSAGGDDLIDAGGPTGPPDPDAGGLCGNDIHTITTDPPNVYFVLDASGSMSAPANAQKTRYEAVRAATFNMVTSLGSLINVGAAIFPLGVTGDATVCNAGGEVLPMSPGDPGGNGPTTQAFLDATDRDPDGNTPTAATLVAIEPIVTALPGRTTVVLATDGAPNCDATLICPGSECIPNIEGCDPQFVCCAPNGNCCAPGGPAGPSMCVDRDATVAAIAALEAAGVTVNVIGIPGSQVYKSVLNQMALAGGAAQASPPYYWAVDDLDALGAVLASIAAGVISCAFEVTDPPDNPNYTNVYLDQALVKQDPKDGWIWKTPTTVELRGAACNKLKTGQVKQVQVVSGCPTEATK